MERRLSTVIISMSRPKLYKINEGCFNEINSHAAAYVLGYIYSDGHVGSRDISFTCKKDDVELLKAVRSHLESTHPIKIGKLYARFAISNIALAETLRNKWRIPSNKNNSIYLPDIHSRYLNSFLLGFFDGDGSISSRGKDFTICFSGGYNILLQIKKLLDEKFGLNMYLRPRYSASNLNSWMLEQHGRLRVEKILDWLHHDYETPLKRKKEKYLLAKTFTNSFLPEPIVDSIFQLYNSGMSQKNISKKLGLNYSTVKSRVQRLKKSKT